MIIVYPLEKDTHLSFKTGGTGMLRYPHSTEIMLLQYLHTLVSLTSCLLSCTAENELELKVIKRQKTKFLI